LPQERPVKKNHRWLAVWTVFTLALLACRVGASPVGMPPTQAPSPIIFAPTLAAPLPADVMPNQDVLVGLYERVNPGIVAIRVLTEQGGGLGSGFVFDMDGYVVTNAHVVEGQTYLEVDFPNGLKVRGELVATDLDSDLAVIKVSVPADQLHPLALADSHLVRVGQTVVAIGNPFGLSGTMTVGIVSGVGRTLASLREAPGGAFFTAAGILQTDAAINPGNSGGPLLNLNGEVIGLNRAIRTDSFNQDGEPTNSGVGFAVSSNIIRRVVPGLIQNGAYDYPYIGVTCLSEITLLQQEALGLPQSIGAYVTSVTAGGPAEKAGLRKGERESSIGGLYAGGDLIIAVDGIEVRQFNDVISYMILHKSPGDTMQLTVLRDGKEVVEIQLTLEKRP
jgi:S1-C subfamily serine protease